MPLEVNGVRITKVVLTSTGQEMIYVIGSSDGRTYFQKKPSSKVGLSVLAFQHVMSNDSANFSIDGDWNSGAAIQWHEGYIIYGTGGKSITPTQIKIKFSCKWFTADGTPWVAGDIILSGSYDSNSWHHLGQVTDTGNMWSGTTITLDIPSGTAARYFRVYVPDKQSYYGDQLMGATVFEIEIMGYEN